MLESTGIQLSWHAIMRMGLPDPDLHIALLMLLEHLPHVSDILKTGNDNVTGVM